MIEVTRNPVDDSQQETFVVGMQELNGHSDRCTGFLKRRDRFFDHSGSLFPPAASLMSSQFRNCPILVGHEIQRFSPVGEHDPSKCIHLEGSYFPFGSDSAFKAQSIRNADTGELTYLFDELNKYSYIPGSLWGMSIGEHPPAGSANSTYVADGKPHYFYRGWRMVVCSDQGVTILTGEYTFASQYDDARDKKTFVPSSRLTIRKNTQGNLEGLSCSDSHWGSRAVFFSEPWSRVRR